MHTISKLICAVALSVGLLTAVPATAMADTPGCVTRAEHRKVKDGMTLSQVRRIYDARGRLENIGSGGMSREYRTCAGDSWSYASVDFERKGGAWRVWFKWIYISY